MEDSMELMVAKEAINMANEMFPKTIAGLDHQAAQFVNPVEAQMELAKEGIEILDKGIVAIKKIDVINSLDKVGALVAEKMGDQIVYKLRTPKEKFNDNLDKAEVIADFVKRTFPEASSAIDQILCNFLLVAAKEAENGYIAFKKLVLSEVNKNRGSKVKADRFEGCPIVYAGDVSYIEIIDGLRLYLTPECVESCTYDRKKYKKLLGHHHYYCNINFKDGTRSYIRVSKKHLKNLIQCGLVLPADIQL